MAGRMAGRMADKGAGRDTDERRLDGVGFVFDHRRVTDDPPRAEGRGDGRGDGRVEDKRRGGGRVLDGGGELSVLLGGLGGLGA